MGNNSRICEQGFPIMPAPPPMIELWRGSLLEALYHDLFFLVVDLLMEVLKYHAC